MFRKHDMSEAFEEDEYDGSHLAPEIDNVVLLVSYVEKRRFSFLDFHMRQHLRIM
jgi:hypothetical protein